MRLFIVVGIFTIVHQPEDYLLYAGLTSLGSIAAGLIGVGVALCMFKLRPVIPSWGEIWEALVEGWMLFLSTISISLYTVGNAFILGLLTNHTVVGYYSAAEKIVKAVLGLLGPISQAAYPKFSKMASESKTWVLQWGRRMLLLMSSLGLALSVALFVGAPVIVSFVLGPGYEPSITVMRILAVLPLLIGASNVLGAQIMFPFRLEKAVTMIVFVAGLVNLALAVLFAPARLASGMAMAVLISEAFVTTALLTYLWVNGLNPLTKLKSKKEGECHSLSPEKL
jgi:PST family polysaccharide transporter